MSNLSTYFPSGRAFPVYAPGMMQFDGSTGYYNQTSFISVGNKVTLVGRIKSASSTSTQWVGGPAGPSGYQRGQAVLIASNSSTADEQNKLVVYAKSSSNVQICRLISDVDVADDEEHTFFFAFDADNGTAILIIDGEDADNISAVNRTLTTGTLDSGASSKTSVGATTTGANKLTGSVGFFGHRDAYLTNWQDFMDHLGNPAKLDESLWTEWGGQPLFWNASGFMQDNRGSAGDMTVNGTIVVADAEEIPAVAYNP